MVAPRRTKKVFCTVVRVPVADNTTMRTQQRFSTRPSDLIPWADPYIAKLVKNLQSEIRSERTQLAETNSSKGVLSMDLDPPPFVAEPEWDWSEEPRWSYDEEI